MQLQSGKMQNGVEGMRGKQASQPRLVAQVEIGKSGPAACDVGDPVEDGAFAVAQVIDDEHIEALRQKFDDSVRPNIAGAAGDKNL